jgi:prephenate dehydrogenase
MPRDALIVGLGLIGGSIGIALRRRGWQVRYVDPHVELDEARRRGAADEVFDSATEPDVVIVATAVDVALTLLPDLATPAVVTSVCSVMKPLRDAARGRFVAGHPMAGSEQRGLAAADGDLFLDKAWFLDGEEELVDAVVRDCGARIERVDAAEHDAAVALTSHLPQVLSTALAAYLEQQDVLRFAGSGLRDFLRLAGSDASVWMSILDANRANIEPHLNAVLRIARELDAETFAAARRVFDKLR